MKRHPNCLYVGDLLDTLPWHHGRHVDPMGPWVVTQVHPFVKVRPA